jgi:hypothetical protein
METTQQASEPPIKAPDFGEPWHMHPALLVPMTMHRSDGNLERAIACVNACAGMADPAREIASLRDHAGRTHELATQVSVVVAQREAKQEELDSITSVIPADAPCLHAETGETVADYILGLQKEVGRVHALYFDTSQQLEAMRDAITAVHKFVFDILRNYECGLEIDLKCEATLAKLQPFLPKP